MADDWPGKPLLEHSNYLHVERISHADSRAALAARKSNNPSASRNNLRNKRQSFFVDLFFFYIHKRHVIIFGHKRAELFVFYQIFFQKKLVYVRATATRLACGRIKRISSNIAGGNEKHL